MRESIEYYTRKRFLGCIGKTNSTNIVLKYKPGDTIYNREIFFNEKKINFEFLYYL